MHAKADDWTQAMQSLIEFTETPTSVVVALPKAAASLSSVKINGASLATTLYQLQDDKAAVTVNFPFMAGQNYEIEVSAFYEIVAPE